MNSWKMVLFLQKQQGPQFIETKDFLCYYYYGGMIYAALKQFDRALYFFEIVSRLLKNYIVFCFSSNRTKCSAILLFCS